MKILIAPDKFKGSLSAIEVCSALTRGLKKNNSSTNIFSCPMADGGDGSLKILNHYLDLKPQEVEVNDPLFNTIKSTYYISQNTAYIEMSLASGLDLLDEEERNCMYTSSFGTGELINDAIKKGVTTINLYVGGSATNDCGIGIASALGFEFYDSSNNLLSPVGKNLMLINRIDKSNVLFNFQEIKVKVLTDVNNILYGKNGAAYVYAAQKGASLIEIEKLDKGLLNFESKLLTHGFPSIAKIPGSGAGGGVGGGAVALLDAKLVSGVEEFIKITQLESLISDSDLVITGEGKLDSQTQQGKVVHGVCNLSKKFNKPIIVVCGDSVRGNYESLGFKKVYKILDKAKSIDSAMKNTRYYLSEIGKEIAHNFDV